MARDEAIVIHGLAEFNRNLRKLDRDLPKGLRLAGNKAAEIVVGKARPLVPVRSGAAQSSVRAKSTRTEARIAGGGARVPYYPWLDFGGSVGRNNSVSRPFLKDGRFIWKAFKDNRRNVEETLKDALIEVAEGAGLGVD